MHTYNKSSQTLRSSLLRSDREDRADTNLCWRYACFSPTSEGSNVISVTTKHWSADCRVFQICSASPVERNECVKETCSTHRYIVKVQSSNFKRLRKSEAAAGPPQRRPASDGLAVAVTVIQKLILQCFAQYS